MVKGWESLMLSLCHGGGKKCLCLICRYVEIGEERAFNFHFATTHEASDSQINGSYVRFNRTIHHYTTWDNWYNTVPWLEAKMQWLIDDTVIYSCIQFKRQRWWFCTLNVNVYVNKVHDDTKTNTVFRFQSLSCCSQPQAHWFPPEDVLSKE